jgi:Ca2+-binding RTX toxin-like protein
VFTIDATGANLRRLTGPFLDDMLEGPGGEQPTWWPNGSRLFYFGQRYPGPPTVFQMNADGTCEGRFAPSSPDLHDPAWRPSPLSLPGAIACADLRVRGRAEKLQLGLGEKTRIRLFVDNDGSVAATNVHVDMTTAATTTLNVESTNCGSSGTTTSCFVDRVNPGGTAELVVEVSRVTAGPLLVQFHVSSAVYDSDSANNNVQLGTDVLPCTVVGSWGDDYLYGTPKADKICGLPGADRIFSRGGNDFIDAGNGDDRIYPGAGFDTVIARGGDDTVYARDGQRDWIDCGAQTDIAVVDRIDVVRHCEYVARPPRG